MNVKFNSKIALVGVVLGLLGTILGAWWITGAFGENMTGFFHEPLNLTMIIASTSLFLILIAIPKTKIESHNKNLNRLLHWIGKNTLPIYLIHVIVMETFQNGYLGFALNMNVMNPVIEIPLLTALTFTISALLVYPLKKIPYIKRVMG